MYIKITSLVLFLFGLFSFNSAVAADDIFLCSEAFEGETQNAHYQGCVDVESWSWGESFEVTLDGSISRGYSKVEFEELIITKKVDKSSPVLMVISTETNTIPMVELFVDRCEVGCKERTPYYRLRLDNVLVSSVMLGGQGGGPGITENVSLNFSKVEWCYRPLVGEDLVPEVCGTWDLLRNEP